MFGEKPILIVEDEFLVGLDLSLSVEGMHGRVIGPVATVAEALELIECEAVAAAILDANLADRDVTPLALRLVEMGVPFVILTGTGIPTALAARHPGLPVVMKPVHSTIALVCLLNEMRHPGCQTLLA